MKYIFKFIRSVVQTVRNALSGVDYISVSPLFLLFGALLFIIISMHIDMYAFPESEMALSPNNPVQLIDLESAFIRENGISPNTADIEELCIFPGVGEKTAQAFLNERELNGPFFLPEDILAVKGIGKKKLENIRPLMTLP